ncbi:hypothetical protein THIX_60832 [Thiomonas sp. X19]|nr:hypothetical protein THIX_60832 [Thiomonas sp. X19]
MWHGGNAVAAIRGPVAASSDGGNLGEARRRAASHGVVRGGIVGESFPQKAPKKTTILLWLIFISY